MRYDSILVTLSIYTISSIFVGCGSTNPKIEQSKIIDDQQKAYQQITTAQTNIQSGDLITRTGNDITSYSLKQFSRKDNTYSHCGIASIENDIIFVYHAIGGEFNPDQKLKRETFAQFCNPKENEGFGIYRFPISKELWNNLHAIILEYYRAGIKFDMKFDLATDDRMYCAEFVSKAYSKAFQNPHMFSTYHIKKWEYIAVDNLSSYKTCIPITKVVFNPN